MFYLKKDLQNEAIKQKATLASEVTSLRGDLQQIRDDRDRQLLQVQALSAEALKYKECAGMSIAELDRLTGKISELEVCFQLLLLIIYNLELETFSDSYSFLFCVSQLVCVKMSKLDDCKSSWHLQKRSLRLLIWNLSWHSFYYYN